MNSSSRTYGLPALAPRPVTPASNNAVRTAAGQGSAPTERHAEAEWAAMHPHIRRMYVQERRKLRYVMRHMEEEYGFKATPQMYKKRFAKWGFHKNTRAVRRKSYYPSTTAHPALPQRKLSIELIMEPGYRGADAPSLLFLNSIKAWGSVFFETVLHDSTHSDLDSPIPTQGSGDQPFDLEQLSFSFRLVTVLLRRGHGVRAGRLARKSFLQVENMLDLEGPLVTWDLLEILHNIALVGQADLFKILVRHMSNLARSRFPETHPLVPMLDGLQGVMRRAPDSSLLYIATLIKRGWLLNAGLVLSNVHSRFQLMYHRFIWDSKELRLPQEAPRRIGDWCGTVRAENPLAVQAAADFEETGGPQLERIMYASLAFPTNGGYAQRSRPPANYYALRLSSIADLRRQSEMKLMDENMKLQVLMGLMKSGMTSGPPGPASTAGGDAAFSSPGRFPGLEKVPRLHVRMVAFMATIALDTDLALGIGQDAAAARLRGIIALREYGQSAIDPQVVHALWRLSDVLARAGRSDEAAAAAREASKRLDVYFGDIPETLDVR